MIKTLQNTLKQDKEGFALPKSVQDAIPIRRLWPDGVFQFGSKFSKTIRFSDINYAIASKEDKTSMFLGYSELLNALDTGSTTKITINNKRLNRQDFEQKILLPRQNDYLDGYRAEYNAMLMDKVTDSSNSVVQERYITLSVHRKNIEEAHMRNRKMIAEWCYEQGRDERVIERIVENGKTYFVVNDFEKLRELFGRMLCEMQRIKSEGDYDAGAAMVERYAVQVEPELHREVLERYAALDIAPYGGFVNPEYELVEQDGRVVDVKIVYPNDYAGQMLHYSKDYSFLPNRNCAH